MIKQNTKSNTKHPLSQSLPHSSRLHPPRLSFFGKGITYIDRLQSLPQQFKSQIKQIDLSHNAIVKLQNLKQFPNLQILNLAHNYINDGKQITKLSKLNKLKSIMIKGNPFLKSGQGLMEALRFLIRYQTDIAIFNNKNQKILGQVLKKYCLLGIKKHYLAHVQNKIQFITEYPLTVPQPISQQLHQNIMQSIFYSKIQQFYMDFRKEVINLVIKDKDQQIQFLDCKQDLDKLFEQKIRQFQQKLDSELMYQQKMVKEAEQLLKHARIMKKGKQRKEDCIMTFKKLNKKPLISKFDNYEKTPKITRQVSPRKNPRQLQSQNIRISPKKNISNIQNEISFQSYYTSMLSKNPVYQLLYSPLTSLKSKQKDLLIQTLSAHLKQKSFTVFKNQKLKEQLQQVNKYYVQKQKLLKLGEQKFLEYKITMTQRVNYLQETLAHYEAQLKQTTQNLEKYVYENRKHSQKILYLQQQLSQYKLKTIKQTTSLQKYSHTQQIYQQIRNIRQKTIKKQYLRMIIKKSQKLHSFHQIQKQNRIKSQQQLVYSCFKQLYKQLVNKKNKKMLQKKVQQNKIRYLMKNFIQNQSNALKQVKYNKNRNLNLQLKFISYLKKQYLINKQIKTKCDKLIKKSDRRLQQKYFKNLKIQLQQRKHIQNIQKAQIFYKYMLKQKMLKNWKIYVKLPIYQQAQIAVDLKTAKMSRFINLLNYNFIENTRIKQKFINLVVFLNQNRRIKYFFKFKQYAVLNTQIRNCKQKHIGKMLKLNYFYQILKTLAQHKNKKQQQEQKNTKLLNLRKKGIFDKLNSEAYNKYLRHKKFTKLIQSYRKINIGLSLRQSLKQFMIQDKRKKNDLKTFFTVLQIKNKNKLKIQNKSIQLKLFLNKNRIVANHEHKKMFFNIFLSSLRQKQKLVSFLDRKYYKLMLKYYNQWRMQIFKNQIQYYKKRIVEFGPQIQQISKRQRAVYEQKQMLVNIIENKQKTIKQYLKQLQQAQYTIQAKQSKYLKLKQFLHESGQDISVSASKIQSYDHKIPERDYDTFLLQDKKDYFDSFRRF